MKSLNALALAAAVMLATSASAQSRGDQDQGHRYGGQRVEQPSTLRRHRPAINFDDRETLGNPQPLRFGKKPTLGDPRPYRNTSPKRCRSLLCD